MLALSNKHSSGHRMATEEEGDQKTPGNYLEKEMWIAGFQYRWR